MLDLRVTVLVLLYVNILSTHLFCASRNVLIFTITSDPLSERCSTGDDVSEHLCGRVSVLHDEVPRHDIA
jgi:hypothetical protein